MHGGFGWMLAAWIPAYADSAIVFSAEGEAQGVLNAANGLAGFAGAVIGGQVASQAGYPAALALGAAATAAGLLIFTVKLLLPPSRRAAPSPAARG